MTDWRDHPLCAPRTSLPSRFWGPERLDPEAWRGFAELLDPALELLAIIAALGDSTDVVDVGGGTGLLTQTIAARVPVIVVEPAAEQRAHLPPNITVIDGRAEALPLPDGAADATLASWVLQYTDDPDRAVTELARVARRRVVIVQAAPNNELVEVYNREAAIAGSPPAHHGYLLSRAAAHLESVGFTVRLEHVAIPLCAPPGGAADLAELLSRMHWADHPRRAEMAAATTGFLSERLSRGPLADDGVILRATR